jgi:hypothetical protein
VVLKTTPPAPPVFDKLPSSTRRSAVTVTGTADQGIRVEIFMNNRSQGAVRADEKGVFSTKVILNGGNNAFTAVSTDAVGNVSEPSYISNVYLDTTPPKIL